MFLPWFRLLKKGFTLVEVLIVVFLMGIMAAVAIPRVASFNATQSLEQSALDFAAVMAEAKSKSASSELYNGNQSEYGVVAVSGSEYCLGQRPDGAVSALACTRRYFLPSGVTVAALFPAIGLPQTVFDRVTGAVLAGSGSYEFSRGSSSILVTISANGKIEIN